MCLYVLYLNVRYRHIHANMNLLVSYICLYLVVSDCMWKKIWNCIHAHMIWYSNSILPVSVCISARHTVTYDLIWNSYLLVFDCVCLYLPVYSAVYACINRSMFTATAAAPPRRPRRPRCRCSTLATLPLNVRRAGRVYAGRLPFLFGPDSAVTAVACGKRSGALKCLGTAGCHWFMR